MSHTTKHDIYHRLLRFDSYRIPHMNAPWVGDRYACVFYNKDLNYTGSNICTRSNHIKRIPPSDTIDVIDYKDTLVVQDARANFIEVLGRTRFPQDRTSGLSVSKKYGDTRGTFLSFGISKTRQSREKRHSQGLYTRKAHNINNIRHRELYEALCVYINAMVPGCFGVDDGNTYHACIVAKNSQCLMHKDKGNIGPCMITAVGNYEHGELVVERPIPPIDWLSPDAWSEYFKCELPTTFRWFMGNAQVRLSNGLLKPFHVYVNEKKIPSDTCQKLFEDVVLYRETYVQNMYTRSLKIPDLSSMTEHKLSVESLSHMKWGLYKNIARNLYWREILQTTHTVHANVPSYLDVAHDLFCKYIIDYKLLSKSVVSMWRKGRVSRALSPLYFRASIMNPLIPYSLYDTILKSPRKILTPTMGWSSYMIGFMQHANLTNYIGIDVIPRVCEMSRRLANQYRPDVRTEIYCQPSEHLAKNMEFVKSHTVDAVFFSPPYFKLEMYADGEQSTKNYNTLESWMMGYWEPTAKMCYDMLRPGGIMCYVVSDYKGVDLVKRMCDAVTNIGFIKLKWYYIHGSNVHFTKHRQYMETICVFQK